MTTLAPEIAMIENSNGPFLGCVARKDLLSLGRSDLHNGFVRCTHKKSCAQLGLPGPPLAARFFAMMLVI
jgi:hypothetical protein